jgi:hypothetical protein
MLSDSLLGINKMIKNFEVYVSNNGLKVNLDKSMIMVCRKAGRLKNTEKFYYQNQPITITNKYKYLGITVTSAGKFYKHWKDKLTVAKFSINSLYCLLNKNINTIKPKLKLFDTISKAIVCYGAQVWGGFRCNDVETAQLFFLKKLLRLPFWTPNYIVLLETGRHSLFITTLRLHFNFIIKILLSPTSKIVYKCLQSLIYNNNFIVKNINTLATGANVTILTSDWENTNLMKIHFDFILAFYLNSEKNYNLREALNSTTRVIYKNIKVDNDCEKYLLQLPIWKSRILIKFRSETFFLNFNAGKDSYEEDLTNKHCNLCNLRKVENLTHLVFECPHYKGFRNKYFRGIDFNFDYVINQLKANSVCFWDNIVYFMEDVLNLRKIWLDEMED